MGRFRPEAGQTLRGSSSGAAMVAAGEGAAGEGAAGEGSPGEPLGAAAVARDET